MSQRDRYNGHAFQEGPDQPGTMTWIADHLITIKEDVSEIKARLIEGDHRMTKIEQQAKPARIPTVLAFAKEVATFREWVLGAAIVVMALRGILQPAEAKALVISVLQAMLK